MKRPPHSPRSLTPKGASRRRSKPAGADLGGEPAGQASCAAPVRFGLAVGH